MEKAREVGRGLEGRGSVEGGRKEMYFSSAGV